MNAIVPPILISFLQSFCLCMCVSHLARVAHQFSSFLPLRLLLLCLPAVNLPPHGHSPQGASEVEPFLKEGSGPPGMEVGQTATAGQHYPSKRWTAECKTFYTPESWKDRQLSSGGGGRGRAWDDARNISPPSSSPASLSSLLPILGTDGSVDKVLYQNLVEVIPLVETFMDQQSSNLFTRHASVIYTPTPPPRDTQPFKKAVDQPFKGKRGHGQFFSAKRGDPKDGLFWDHGDPTLSNSKDLYSEEVPMLSFPTGHQVDQSAFRAEIVELQAQVEQLEQKLQEKDCQSQAAENSVRQIDLLQLQRDTAELQKRILAKEQEAQGAYSQLAHKEQEFTSLQALLEKANADVRASNAKLVQVQEELQCFQCQMAMYLYELLNIAACFDEDHQEFDEAESSSTLAASSMETKAIDHLVCTGVYDSETRQVELTRRKYLAALIAARENPEEELLLLVAELRAQLQAYLMQPDDVGIMTS